MPGQKFFLSFIVLSLFSGLAFPEAKFKDSVTKLEAIADEDFAVDLRQMLTNPSEPDLTWKATPAMPKWLTLDSANSKLSGRPSEGDLGLAVFAISVFQGETSDILHRTEITVTAKPRWKNIVNFGKHPQDAAFSYDLKNDVHNPSNLALEFSVSSKKPKWLDVSATGTASGTPARKDIGVYEGFTVTFRSPFLNHSDTTNAKGEVTIVYAPPAWTASPVVLPNANEDAEYNEGLSKFVKNPEGGPLKFETLSPLPAWLKVSESGTVSGTPLASDLGPVAFTARVTSTIDGNLLDGGNTQIQFTVLHVNHAPKWQQPISFTIPEEQLWLKDLAPYASDVDSGDKLTFKKISGPAWAEVSETGIISGTPQVPDEGDNKFVVEVNDGQGGSARGNVTVTVLHVNHAPKWQQPIAFSTPIEKLFSEGLSKFASDSDGDKLTYTKISGPAWATISEAGVISGTPQVPDEGDNTFTVSADDGNGGTVQATVTVTVLHVNHAPKWQQPIAFSTPIEQAFSQDLSPFASDSDNDKLTFKKVSGPAWAEISASGVLSGVPQMSDEGDNKFVVSADDGNGGVTSGTVTVTVLHVNHAPKWQEPIVFSTPEESPFSKNLSTFASDVDPNDKLVFAKISGPAWANISSLGVISGTPQMPDEGENKFVVSVDDSNGGVVSTTVIVNVTHVNHAPKWQQPIVFSTPIEQLFSTALALFVSDVDKDKLTFKKISGPAWANIAEDGTISGTPQMSDEGDSKFVVEVNDAAGGTARGNVTVTVLHVNHPPKWKEPITFTTPEEKAFSQSVASFASDIDGEKLTFKKVSGPAWASVSSAGLITGTPQHPDDGENRIAIEANDGVGGVTTTVVVVTVTHVNHAPKWQQPIAFSTPEDQLFSKGLASFASDIDGEKLSFSKVSGPSWAAVAADGTLSGTPSHDEEGENKFIVEANDGVGGTARATVTVTVTHVNHAPTWKEPITFTTPEDKAFSADLAKLASDIDGEKLTFKKIAGPVWAAVSNAGVISGTPSHSEEGENKFSVEASDGKGGVATATVIVTVTHVNHAPKWQQPITFTTPEDQVFSQSVASFASDIDGDKLNFTKISGPSWAGLTADGTLSGTPSHAEEGVNKFVVEVTDGNGGAAKANVTVTVTHVNHAPKWKEPIVFTTPIEQLFSKSLVAYVSDSDGDKLTFAKISGPTWAAVSSAGVLSGTAQIPDEGQNTFVVSADDGNGAVVSTTVIVNVTHVNHSPKWQEPIVFSTPIEVLFSQDLSKFASDVDPNDKLTFTKISGPVWATVSSTGVISGTAQIPDEGENKFVVEVNDGQGATARANVIVTVLHVNHMPKWQEPITFTTPEEQLFSKNIATFASDIDPKDKLTFSKVSGPVWATVSTAGVISGTPMHPDEGENKLVVEVNDGNGGTASATVVVTVTHVNHPPKIDVSKLNFVVKERSTLTSDLQALVTDSDGDKVTFKLVDTASYITLTPEGKLTLAPLFKDIGKHTYGLDVSDGSVAVAVTMTVTVERDPRPPVWKENPIQLQVNLGQSIQDTLATRANDLDGLPLIFSKVSGPTWLKVATDGKLSGTPVKADLGTNSFEVRVKNDLLSADAVLTILVIDPNRKPYWVKNPIPLLDATVDSVYSQSVAPLAKDDDVGDTLTFSKLEGPEWLMISSTGTVMGTPAMKDIGSVSMKVRVADNHGAYADATVEILVNDRPNQPAKWLKDPIPLGNVIAGDPFTFDLASLAMDPDNDPLVFSKTAGPGWLVVSNAGKITGTPSEAYVGEYTATFTVTDGRVTVPVQAFGKVLSSNPVIVAETLTFIVKERATLEVNLNDPKYVVDPKGRPLTFELSENPKWLSMAVNGNTIMKPEHEHLGTHSFTLTVKNDIGGSTSGPFIVFVVRDPRPPFWVEDPIRFTVKANTDFTADISAKAKDPDNLPLTFEKVDGPGWLGVSNVAVLTGRPTDAHKGENVFHVRAKNDLLFADVTVIITVTAESDTTDVTTIDAGGGGIEDLWVVGNSPKSSAFMRSITDNIETYYIELRKANVKSSAIFITADGLTVHRNPFQSEWGDLLMTTEQGNVTPDWAERTADAWVSSPLNSPIFSLDAIYKKLPKLTSIYKKRYMMPGVPSRVTIFTTDIDNFRQFAAGPKEQWEPEDYAKANGQLHADLNKTYKVNAVIQRSEKPGQAPGQIDHAYYEFTEATGGKVYPWVQGTDTGELMRDLAKEAILGASLNMKRRIKLNHVPSDPKTIEVYVAGMKIFEWVYDAKTNEVVIDWTKIDTSKLKPGDKIEIKYRYQP